MKAYTGKIVVILIAAAMLVPTGLKAQNQNQQEPPDYIELAEKEADKLQESLDLDDYQTFYVDSTLKHDYVAYGDEIMNLQKSKVTNSTLYIDVQDKWMQAIDDSFRKIFTDEQWEKYLRTGAARNQKAREKRRERAAQGKSY